MSNVTVCITSFNRFDLLKQTLNSFLKFNTYDIKTFLIVEDSTNKQCCQKIKRHFPFIQIIENNITQGQIKSIDILYENVTTEYIFHCEDDWLFTKSGFIEKSMIILNECPDIFQVWIRDRSDHMHPFTSEKFLVKNIEFRELTPMWKDVYSGFTFNPSLRRLRDYKLLQRPFSTIGVEATIGVVYLQMGFRFVSLLEGFCVHLGRNRHIYSRANWYFEHGSS
jgi:GT2 family glycosyltransferase